MASLRSLMVLSGACGLLFATPAALAQLEQGRRLALVIGNANYSSAPLRNTRNDAISVAEVLRKLDFEVDSVLDGTKAQIDQSLSRLSRRAGDGTTAVVLYYAGHGVQLENKNFIVPVNAVLSSRSDIDTHAIDISSAIASLRLPVGVTKIVILDSCRDNPFGTIGSGVGLTQMDAPSGTLIAFATAPGHVASDGLGNEPNGVYTEALLKELSNPSEPIEAIFKKVRFQVRQRTSGKQVPWESSSLEREFLFASPSLPRPKDEATLLKLELAHWVRVSESRNIDDFYEYVQKYPNGFFVEKAQASIERLSNSNTVRPIGPHSFSVVPTDRPLFDVGDRFVFRSHDANGKPQSTRDLRVTALTTTTVELNNGEEVWDWTGNLITDDLGTRATRAPAKVWIPAELYVGKKWRTAYSVTTKYGSATLFWDFRVDALETLRIPAGDFLTFRVVGSSVVSSGATQSETLWIDAKTFLIVKDVWERRRPVKGEVKVEASYNRELTQIHRKLTR